jgi:hypothetical protein
MASTNLEMLFAERVHAFCRFLDEVIRMLWVNGGGIFREVGGIDSFVYRYL